MTDVAMLVCTAVFFLAAIAYVRVCDRLRLGGGSMLGNIVLLVIVVLLFGYLLVALVRPEGF